MKSFTERLEGNEPVLVGSGYLMELQRRGYCQAGTYVPHVILEQPHIIKAIHEEFVHAGSDVVIACQYNADEHKLSRIDMLDSFEKLNRKALEICYEVSRNTGTLAAGTLSPRWKYESLKNDAQYSYEQFRKGVIWAADTGVDMFLCETFRHYKEASLALKTIKEFAPGLSVLVMVVPHNFTETADGIPYAEAFTKLHNEGAAAVGLNCAMGPETMIGVLENVTKNYKGPLAALPIPYRTTNAEPTWLTLRDSKSGELAYPDDLDAVSCSCKDVQAFGRQAKSLGVKCIGLCCGNSGRYMRALAESIDHVSPADRFKTDNTQVPFEAERKRALEK